MRIGIVGLGLIGGSLGRVFVKNGKHTVFAHDADAMAMKKGAVLGAFHHALTPENAASLDALFIAVHPRATEDCLNAYAPLLQSGAVVTDTCGNKRRVCRLMRELSKTCPLVRFVGGHPMAGREYSGLEYALDTLFCGASVLLTPVTQDIDAISRIKQLYLETGADEVIVTDAETHDARIAYTSQLAHIVSGAYVKSPLAAKHQGFSAGSYRDMTRVSKLHAGMWSELMHDNRDNLIRELDILAAHLQAYRDALEQPDSAPLEKLLREGSDRKMKIDKREYPEA